MLITRHDRLDTKNRLYIFYLSKKREEKQSNYMISEKWKRSFILVDSAPVFPASREFTGNGFEF